MNYLQKHLTIKLIFIVIISISLFPIYSDSKKLDFLEWDPVLDSDLAIYKVYSRYKGAAYDFNSPYWAGDKTSCVIIPPVEGPIYFVVRAVNTNGLESGDSNEVCYGSTLCQNDSYGTNAGVDKYYGAPADIDPNTGIYVGFGSEGDPLLDIEANGLDGIVYITEKDLLKISIELDPKLFTGISTDWWVFAVTSYGLYSYKSAEESWFPGLHTYVQGPLKEVYPSLNLVNRFDLPAGNYIIYFIVDGIMNGELDFTNFVYDMVIVRIMPEDNYSHLQSEKPIYSYGDNNAGEYLDAYFKGKQRIINGEFDNISISDIGAFEFNTPVANYQNLTTYENTPIEIILDGYDIDLIEVFSMDKSDNFHYFSAGGDNDNIPEPSTLSAEGEYSAYFDKRHNEYLILEDGSTTVDMPWKNGTINKTGTVWLKFKTPSYTGTPVTPVLFSKYHIGTDKRTFLVTYRTYDDKIQVNIAYDGGNEFKSHVHDAALYPDTWYAVCVSFAQNGGNSGDPEKVYIEIRSIADGTVIGSNYSTNAFDDPDNDEINIKDGPYMIGAAFQSTDVWMPFQGYIDDVMIFNENKIGRAFEQYAKGNISGNPECHLDFEHPPFTYSSCR